MKHSFEEKLNVVSEITCGKGLDTLCREGHLDKHLVIGWVARYKAYGEDGLRKSTKGYHFTPAEKEKIILEHIKDGVTLQQLSLHYDVNRSTIISWLSKVRSGYPLDLLLKLRKMARSMFYYHLKYLKADDKYAMEKETIKAIYHEHKGRYGYRRVTAEMRNRGFVVNHKSVQRLMDEMCLKSRIRKVRYRSYKGEVGRIAPNIIARDFAAEAPNRKWATDVIQINIGSVKLYLSPILDMFNGEIISYNVSRSPNLEPVYDMLDKAFVRFDSLILHSDQGWQYQHFCYCQRLAEHHIIQSMSRKGNCLDNAMAENFFGIMKSKLLYTQEFESPEAFMKAWDEYIEYYNNKRIKSRLKGKSPVQYRTLSITG